MTTANILSQLGSPGVSTGFKNRIINGAMFIDQRNAGASVTPTNGQYLVDRWLAGLTQASKYTAQQSATAPTGFSNSLLITSSSAYSVLTGDAFYLTQRIEGFNTADLGFGTANAKTITLSFQVYSSLTGTFGGALQNSAANRSYPFSYSIPVANTWTTISVTIAGDTSGTWVGATNGTGIALSFGLGVGTTYSGTAGSWAATNYVSATGATSIVGTNGATFYITGVQLEVGTTATNFDYRSYGTELALCQRYYQQKIKGSYPYSVGFIAYATNAGVCSESFPVTMRATPSVVISTSSGTGYVNLTSTNSNISAPPQQAWWTATGIFGIQPSAGLVAGQGYGFDYTASAEL